MFAFTTGKVVCMMSGLEKAAQSIPVDWLVPVEHTLTQEGVTATQAKKSQLDPAEI